MINKIKMGELCHVLQSCTNEQGNRTIPRIKGRRGLSNSLIGMGFGKIFSYTFTLTPLTT